MNNWKTIAIVAGSVLAVAGAVFFFAKPVVVEGTVKTVSWTRTIDILKKTTVKNDGWEVPEGARVLETRREYKGKKEVPDRVDTDGTIHYRSESEYAIRYYYEIDEWPVVRQVITNAYSDAEGNIVEPYWGEVVLEENERQGSSRETYEAHVVQKGDGTLRTIELGQQLWNDVKPNEYVKATVDSWHKTKVKKLEVLG